MINRAFDQQDNSGRGSLDRSQLRSLIKEVASERGELMHESRLSRYVDKICEKHNMKEDGRISRE
jgi:hypothetical protein